MTYKPEPYMLTAGGNIFCRRCQARSSRSKLQCGRTAMRGKRVCPIHGGKSTGPRTNNGKAHLATAALKTGHFKREEIQSAKKYNIRLRYLEDIAVHLGMVSSRTCGRKPAGYIKLNLNDPEILWIAMQKAGLTDDLYSVSSISKIAYMPIDFRNL